MTQNNKVTTQPILPALLSKRMVMGAGIGFLVISLFLLSVREPDPAWGKLWMIRPLIVVPLAGAVGGISNYFLVHLCSHMGVSKPIATIVSVLVFIIGVWLGTILGLNGTLWD